MHALSDAIRLREAILAERRAERALPTNTVVFPVPAKDAAAPVADVKSPRGGLIERLRAIACL